MEHVLRCNTLNCRADLNDHAVVTTCSHVFCVECAELLRLSNPSAGQRPVCPACDAHLTNPDDAVVTNLNPTEDYKTSVLSGLSPNIIMECAGRALNFWTYQITQEVVYQEFQAKSLTEKYTLLNSQMDTIIHQANAEMSDLRLKMNSMLMDQDNLRRKNEELAQAFRDKSRKHSQTQELYDKLKRRIMLGQVQNAASEAVDYAVHASNISNQFTDAPSGFEQSQPSPLNEEQEYGIHQSAFIDEGGKLPSMQPPVSRNMMNAGRGISNIKGSKDNVTEPSQTPSSHRQRLASSSISSIGLATLQNGRMGNGSTAQRRGTPARQPLVNGNTNIGGNYQGYGLSAGVKVSHQLSVAQNNSIAGRPTVRSRVAQRPASSSFIAGGTPSFGLPSGYNVFGQRNAYN